MRLWIYLYVMLAIIAGCSTSDSDEEAGHNEPKAKAHAHNVIVIIADDMGYSDLGCTGGEIHTPVIDQLAKDGLLFSRFYTMPTCSPFRASFLSGVESHDAGLGSMNGTSAPNQIGKRGYEEHITDRVVLLPEILTKHGVKSYLSGKWHIGGEPGMLPMDRGFDKCFSLIQGASNHLRMQGITPTMDAYFMEGNERLTELPEDYYSTRTFTDKFLGFLEDHEDFSVPFFGVLAYTAPHWPLQAPDDLIEKYLKVYENGWEDAWEKRVSRVVELGLVPEHGYLYGDDGVVIKHPMEYGAQLPDWSDLSKDEKLTQAKYMATYAAMVEYMDSEIGRLLSFLEDHGIRENTTILFMSDNGAAGDDLINSTAYDLDIRDWIKDSFDNSYENIGHEDSFITYGEPWAAVSNAPFRGFKGTTYEGGIRTMLICNGPTNHRSGKSDEPVVPRDLYPTILDMFLLPMDSADYTGKIYPQGRSLFPYLIGERSNISDEPFEYGWELFGYAAYIMDDLKIVREPGQAEWDIYGLESDPTERNPHYGLILTKDSLEARWKVFEEAHQIVFPD